MYKALKYRSVLVSLRCLVCRNLTKHPHIDGYCNRILHQNCRRAKIFFQESCRWCWLLATLRPGGLCGGYCTRESNMRFLIDRGQRGSNFAAKKIFDSAKKHGRSSVTLYHVQVHMQAQVATSIRV